MGRAARGEGAEGRRGLTDIFGNQPGDTDRLAELYDLEHDEQTDDLVFYREFARRARGAILDLGCGSGRLLPALLDGGAPARIVGLDGSPALLARAERRLAADDRLRHASETGRLLLAAGDVRDIPVPDRFSLIVAVGVVPHLAGVADAGRMLRSIRRRLTDRGRAVLDLPGPAALPEAHLPLAVDWVRHYGDVTVKRKSRLTISRDSDDGVRVLLATVSEVEEPDGTIARLPAAFRLWYPSRCVLETLVNQFGLAVEQVYGSHELEPFTENSERLIIVASRAVPRPRG